MPTIDPTDPFYKWKTVKTYNVNDANKPDYIEAFFGRYPDLRQLRIDFCEAAGNKATAEILDAYSQPHAYQDPIREGMFRTTEQEAIQGLAEHLDHELGNQVAGYFDTRDADNQLRNEARQAEADTAQQSTASASAPGSNRSRARNTKVPKGKSKGGRGSR